MVADSVRALIENQSQVAEQVTLRDDTLDALEPEVDTLCHEILALQHPVARDLRFVATAFKIVRDIERIGDLAVNIADRVKELLQEPQGHRVVSLPLMAQSAKNILARSLDAFVNLDLELAVQVIRDDRAIDDMNDQIFRELLSYMIEDTQNVTRALKLIFVAKYLERVGDHATNIAEMVVFMIKGSEARRCLPSSV